MIKICYFALIIRRPFIMAREKKPVFLPSWLKSLYDELIVKLIKFMCCISRCAS